MGSFTNFLEDELLDHVFNASYSSPTNIYLCLCTADPTDAATGGSMNEVANSNGYARTAIDFGLASSGRVTQSGAVNFPQASGGGWGTVSHWAICTSNTYGSGDVLAYGDFTASKTINDGDTPSVADTEVYVEFNATEISDHLEDELLDHCFNNAAYTSPDTYIALCDATVSASDTGSSISEPSGGSYARKQVNPSGGAAPDWNNSSSQTVDNNDDIDFTTATADWGTIVAIAIVDASSGGNLLFFDNTMTDKAVNNGDTAQIPAGDLDITLD